MKRFLTFLVFLSSLNIGASIAPISCRINYIDGSVYLTAKDLEDNQSYESFLGKENFLEPYTYRNLCKQLMSEFDLNANYSWDDNGCDQNGTGERFFQRAIDLKLTNRGIELLEHSKAQVHFYSVNPLESNRKSVFDSKCDWY